MKVPRVRYSLRWLMVAVAMSAAAAAMHVRSDRFRSLAEYHAERIAMWSRGSAGRYRRWVDRRGEQVSEPASRWHASMEKKYGRAARYPFLPVAPDPPRPE